VRTVVAVRLGEGAESSREVARLARVDHDDGKLHDTGDKKPSLP
jgi:hypothetical protein